MPSYECACGAKYRFSDAHAGRKSKCKECGAVFTLARDDDPIPVADAPELNLDIDVVTARAGGVAQTIIPPSTAPGPAVIIEKDEDDPTQGSGGYWSALLWSVLFASQPGDLVVFLFITAILSVFDGVFGFTSFLIMGGGPFVLLVWFIYKGWYASVRFAILQSAAAGEEHLPNINITGDWVEEYIVPALQWAGSWLVVALPVIAYVVLFISNSGLTVFEALGIGFVPPAPIEVLASEVSFWLAIAVGIFIWPMVILCIALGGLSTVLRIDLMCISILRTLPVYVLTVLIVLVAEVGGYVLRGTIYSAIAPLTTTGGLAPLGDRMIAACSSNAVYVYVTIVMLRAIGLYYHHFKHRFAWNWG